MGGMKICIPFTHDPPVDVINNTQYSIYLYKSSRMTHFFTRTTPITPIDPTGRPCLRACVQKYLLTDKCVLRYLEILVRGLDMLIPNEKPYLGRHMMIGLAR